MSNVIIINAYFKGEDPDKKLAEIKALCSAVNAEVVGVVTKFLTRINPATVLGKGKLYDIKELAENSNADTIIYNGELSPSQTLNIADIVERVVITKTNLILEIFARRATSNEGKILVELAQLKYLYPRLKGKGDSLSRQGGGIGTTGPGETKLETDRRYIKGRILSLERSLKEISKRQKLQQSRRKKNDINTVAIVGYTNVGKSTLLNKLCDSDVFEMDQVFATLDPTARTTKINGEKIIFVDTVGFIKDLPKSLVEAFKSTLEIAKTANLLLCVSDASDDFISQRETADDILNEIGATNERLYVLNKCDRPINSFVDGEYVKISARTGSGLEELKEIIYKKLFGKYSEYAFSIAYSDSPIIDLLKKRSLELNVTYGEENITLSGKVKFSDKDFITEIREKYSIKN